jgi:hypothetical protein
MDASFRKDESNFLGACYRQAIFELRQETERARLHYLVATGRLLPAR